MSIYAHDIQHFTLIFELLILNADKDFFFGIYEIEFFGFYNFITLYTEMNGKKIKEFHS